MVHPIENIQWLDAELLRANDYNPNVVYNQELRLLEHSILLSGWIQPLLITQDYEIIDGFHRWTLTKMSKELNALTEGKVPCCVMTLTEPERMMLTIRINRAKGNHIAVKMHEVITKLVEQYGISLSEIGKNIGANKDEVELLCMDGVFKKLDIQNHKYSKAWVPAKH
jgi:ParB-like chromosome segregation protein Spo0J